MASTTASAKQRGRSRGPLVEPPSEATRPESSTEGVKRGTRGGVSTRSQMKGDPVKPEAGPSTRSKPQKKGPVRPISPSDFPKN
jgi:hypothetical protein